MSPLLFLFLFSEDALAVAAGSSGGGGHVRTAGGQQSAQRQQRQQRQLHPSGPPGPGRPGPSKAALLSPGSADSRLPHLRGLGDRERPLCCAFWGHASGILPRPFSSCSGCSGPEGDSKPQGKKASSSQLLSCRSFLRLSWAVHCQRQPRCECRPSPTFIASGRCTSNMPRSWISAFSSAQASG